MRARSKPTSMMTSNKTSVTSEAMILGLVVSKLGRTQVFASGDHSERIYGCQVSLAGSNQSKLKIHPYHTCDITGFTSYKIFFHDMQEVLTIDEKSDVYKPYCRYNYKNDFLPVPNGESAKIP